MKEKLQLNQLLESVIKRLKKHEKFKSSDDDSTLDQDITKIEQMVSKICRNSEDVIIYRDFLNSFNVVCLDIKTDFDRNVLNRTTNLYYHRLEQCRAFLAVL